MKALSTLAGLLLLAPAGLLAQTAPPTPAPTGTAAAGAPATADARPAPIPLAPVTPAADPNALKIKVDVNPISHLLTVRCDAPGPTRIEINDKEGRPILTKNTLVGTTPVSLNVSALPAGPYVVRCTAADKKGTKLVQIN